MKSVSLGQRVHAYKVFEWPDKSKLDDLDEVGLEPVDNPLADKVAVVVGQSRKKYHGKVNYYCTGDGGATCGSEGHYVDMSPSTQTFIAIRYTLRGRRYFTTAEHLRGVNT